jgi:cytochrome oxidase Cu insertion factor (SCO1/SenC/PrrC family)
MCNRLVATSPCMRFSRLILNDVDRLRSGVYLRAMNKRIAISGVLLLALATGSAQTAAKAGPPPEPAFKVGEAAPDFTLLDQNRKEVKLSDFRGKKNVVLAFYVFAFTGG